MAIKSQTNWYSEVKTGIYLCCELGRGFFADMLQRCSGDKAADIFSYLEGKGGVRVIDNDDSGAVFIANHWT